MSIFEKPKPSCGKKEEANFDMPRREFAKWALAGALGGAGLLAHSRPAEGKLANLPPGPKIALQLDVEPPCDH